MHWGWISGSFGVMLFECRFSKRLTFIFMCEKCQEIMSSLWDRPRSFPVKGKRIIIGIVIFCSIKQNLYSSLQEDDHLSLYACFEHYCFTITPFIKVLYAFFLGKNIQ